MNSISNKILKGTSINTIGLFATMFINLVVISQIVIKLGLESLGMIALASLFSIIGIVSLLDFGVPGALTREFSLLIKREKIREARELFWSCLLLFFIIGIVVSIMLIFLSDFIAQDMFGVDPILQGAFQSALIFMFISHVYQFPALILKAIFRGYSMFGHLQAIVVATELFRAFIITVALMHDFEFDLIIVINATIPIIALIFFLLYLPSEIRGEKIYRNFKFGINQIKTLASFIFAQRISAALFNNMDRLLTGIMLGPVYVGAVEIFSKAPLLFNKTLGLSISAIVPAVSGLSVEQNRKQLFDIYHNGFKIYYVAVVPLLILTIVFTPSILKLWVDISDQFIIDCMRIMCVWCLLVPLQFGGNMLIGVRKKVGAYTNFIVSLAVVKLLVILILMPFIGVYALPISYLIASMGTLYLLFTLKSALSIDLGKQFMDIFKVILSCIFPFLLVWFVDLDVSSFLDLLLWSMFFYVQQMLIIYIYALNADERVWLKQSYNKITSRFI